MSDGAWMMVIALALAAGSLLFLLFSMVRSIRDERTPGRSIWREFGLGIGLMVMFFATWIAQGIAEWQVYTDEQLAHGDAASIGGFISQFGQSTLENWQSEFLQLFAFVVLATLYIHKGSGESKDGTEKLEASLRRIEEQLGTLPGDTPDEPGEEWKLPDSPLAAHDRVEGSGPGNAREWAADLARTGR